eukprot:GILI01010486.1.p1 GENE.GILI01010486.1~~GILI01010486.1.p1  ORF type:complete len:626 (+),score=141.62 GILI01010486.1:460-2337(+)
MPANYTAASTNLLPNGELAINRDTIFRNMGMDEDDDALVTAHWIQAPPQHLLGGGGGAHYPMQGVIGSQPGGQGFVEILAPDSPTHYSRPSTHETYSMGPRNNNSVSGASHNSQRGNGATSPMAPPPIHSAHSTNYPTAVEEDSPNLFIANLSNDVDDDALTAVFSPFGYILSVKVMLDIHTGRSRGFGFVMFDDGANGAAAMRALHNVQIGEKGQRMSVTKAQTSGQSAITETTKLYVRNVPLTVSEQALKDHFAQFGVVRRFARKEDTASKNDASRQSTMRQQSVPAAMVIFLEYNSVQEAQNAVKGIHGKKPWPGMGIPLLAKTAETTENRNVRRERQRQKVDDKRIVGPMGVAIPTAALPSTPSASLHVHATYSPNASLMMSASTEVMNNNNYPYMDTIYNNSVMSVGANAGSSSFAPASLPQSPQQNVSAPVPMGNGVMQSQLGMPYPMSHQQQPPPMYGMSQQQVVQQQRHMLPGVMDISQAQQQQRHMPFTHMQAPYQVQQPPTQYGHFQQSQGQGNVMYMIGSDGLARPMLSGSSNPRGNASASMSHSQDNMQALAPSHMHSHLQPQQQFYGQQMQMQATPYGGQQAPIGNPNGGYSQMSLDPQLLMPMGSAPPGMR